MKIKTWNTTMSGVNILHGESGQKYTCFDLPSKDDKEVQYEVKPPLQGFTIPHLKLKVKGA